MYLFKSNISGVKQLSITTKYLCDLPIVPIVTPKIKLNKNLTMVSKYNYKLSCGHYLLYRNIEDKPRKLQDTKKKKLKTHLPLTLAYKIHYFFFFTIYTINIPKGQE